MDDLFGGMFDFNGDDKTDPIESGLGYMIIPVLEAGQKRYDLHRDRHR